MIFAVFEVSVSDQSKLRHAYNLCFVLSIKSTVAFVYKHPAGCYRQRDYVTSVVFICNISGSNKKLVLKSHKFENEEIKNIRNFE